VPLLLPRRHADAPPPPPPRLPLSLMTTIADDCGVDVDADVFIGVVADVDIVAIIVIVVIFFGIIVFGIVVVVVVVIAVIRRRGEV
jgi:hypothetical protein